MKRIFLMIVSALVCGIVFFSCDKSTEKDELNGIYTGTYTWKNLTHDFSWSSTPTIELKNGKYSYKELSTGDYYNTGSGNYAVDGNKITFELIDFEIPLEDIGVTANWLLNGEYEYRLNENKLILYKKAFVDNDEYSYEFNLKRK